MTADQKEHIENVLAQIRDNVTASRQEMQKLGELINAMTHLLVSAKYLITLASTEEVNYVDFHQRCDKWLELYETLRKQQQP